MVLFELLSKLKFLKKAILPTFFVCLFFLAIPERIKAQIASIISEDGDGIVGITSLMNAAINDDVQAVQFFAKSGAAVVNQKNVGGATALHIAARRGNLEICKILIDNGANINATDNEGWTPLMRAALAKNADLVRILINQGADPRKMNSIGETVIINSASAECSACLEQIFSGYDFVNNLNIDILKKQLEEALLIANNKGDLPTQLVLKEYLNSETNKSKTYSLTNNNNSIPEMPITSNNNRGNGAVVVKSLNDMSSGNNNKSIYKFLPNKSATPIQRPLSPSIPQKSFYNFHSNTLNKTDKEISNLPLSRLPISNNYDENLKPKKFIFKGDKKVFSALNVKSINTDNDNVKSDTKIIQEPQSLNNPDDIVLAKPSNGSNSSTDNADNSKQAVQYKFLGKKKPLSTEK